MKTSKIIIITLLGTIALLIVVPLINMRLNGHRINELSSDFMSKRDALQAFKVITINNSRNVLLVQNDSAFLEVTYLKDSIAPRVNYTIEADTLKLSDFGKSIPRNVSVKIKVTNSLTRIQLKNSDLSMEKFRTGKLSLNLDRSSVSMGWNESSLQTCPFLDIVAINGSHFKSGNFKIDSLGIVLQNSNAEIRNVAKKISGSLTDRSKINTRQPIEITLKRDATSKINVDDY